MDESKKTHNDHSYSQITNRLYLGYNMRCCELHFQKLLSLGISMDVNVEADNEEDPTGMEVHLWLPTREHRVPSPAQLRVGASAIQRAIQSEKIVYVHCEKGHARSVVLVGAYLILTGMTAKDAVKMIKTHRDVIHPGKAHIQALCAFEKEQDP